MRLAGSLPDLQGWHLQKPESEFRAEDAKDDYTLDQYIEQEQQVYNELDELITGRWARQIDGAFCRFGSTSVSNPETIVDRNWNRTHILKAAKPIGGVLLLHGLSDSPYSVRALGLRLHSEGYTVIWLRIPGHGTCPCALANVSSEDWFAAVKVAMRGLRDHLPEGTPLILGGYRRIGDIAECAFVCNCFVANRDILQAIRWDEDLKVDEHWDFFWRAKIAGVRVGVAMDHVFPHIHVDPPTYKQHRPVFLRSALRKHGLRKVLWK